MSEHRIDLDRLAKEVRGHSIFSASSSKMWMGCPGSLVPNVTEKDNSSRAAAEGTVAHAVAEEWLKSGVKPKHLIGKTEVIKESDATYEILIDEVMIRHVEEYVNWVIFEPGEHFIEVPVRYSDITPIPDQGGTADFIAVQPRKLLIADLKYGQGILVEVVNNPQLMLYAYGALRKFEFDYGPFDEIEMRIAQPRMDNMNSWTISRDELMEFVKKAKLAAHDAWRLDAPRRPSEDACQWCKVKSSCAALAAQIMRVTDGAFDDLDAPVLVENMLKVKADLDSGELEIRPINVGALTVEQKAKLYAFKGVISAWLDSIGSELYKRLSDGEQVPGFKLVVGKKQRFFGNEARAAEHLEFLGLTIDDYSPRTFVSPSECEKILMARGVKRKNLPIYLNQIVSSREGNPTMVSESDSRPSLAGLCNSSFDNLDEDL